MRRFAALLVVAVFVGSTTGSAYGVLAHQSIIDTVWESSIVPALRARFPAGPEALRKAHAFAYGGAIIQDSGYYPLSSRTFGDLTHYVRSGDFIVALLHEASTLDEYAFALGALAHYAADNDGHPIAINRAVPILYPKLRTKYGADVTYEENPAAHLRTEFGLDVLQVARGNYRPDAYRDFIGFEVSKPVLERAFKDTYGLELKDVFANFDVAMGTFRWAVGQVIPSMTKVAWDLKRKEIEQRRPGISADRYVFALSRRDFEGQWGTEYKRPNAWHRVLGWIVRVMPKVGPFAPLAFKPPTPETERLFQESFTATLTRYRTLLSDVRRGSLALTNRNFDTGKVAHSGDYALADEAYGDWLQRLADDKFEHATPVIRTSVLAFYANLDRTSVAHVDKSDWRDLQNNLTALKQTRLAAR